MVKNSSFSDNWLKLNKQMNVGVSCQLATPICYLAYISTEVNDKKMHREKLYKICINKSLLTCSDDLSHTPNEQPT